MKFITQVITHKTLLTYYVLPLKSASSILSSPESIIASFPALDDSHTYQPIQSFPMALKDQDLVPLVYIFWEESPVKIFLPCQSDLTHTPYLSPLLIYPNCHSPKCSSIPSPISHPCWIWSLTYRNFQAHPMETA